MEPYFSTELGDLFLGGERQPGVGERERDAKLFSKTKNEPTTRAILPFHNSADNSSGGGGFFDYPICGVGEGEKKTWVE